MSWMSYWVESPTLIALTMNGIQTELQSTELLILVLRFCPWHVSLHKTLSLNQRILVSLFLNAWFFILQVWGRWQFLFPIILSLTLKSETPKQTFRFYKSSRWTRWTWAPVQNFWRSRISLTIVWSTLQSEFSLWTRFSRQNTIKYTEQKRYKNSLLCQMKFIR